MSTPSYTTQTTKAAEPKEVPISHFNGPSFWRGITLGFPIFLGYVPVGLAFGILARTQGFSLLEATICSATALAGAGQFIALATLLAGGDAFTTIVATGVVNLRYVLFGATLSPYLRALKMRFLPWIGYTLTDESFAINVADLRNHTATAGSMSGVGFIAWTGWVLGTMVGVTSAQWIGDPSTWGVDFAMPAMFAALFITLAENRQHVITGIISAGIVIALAILAHLGLPLNSNWFIVVAALGGATIASMIFPRTETLETDLSQGEELTVANAALDGRTVEGDEHE